MNISLLISSKLPSSNLFIISSDIFRICDASFMDKFLIFLALTIFFFNSSRSISSDNFKLLSKFLPNFDSYF